MSFFQHSKFILAFVFSLTFSALLTAQTALCTVASPDNLVLTEENTGKNLSWDSKTGADAYQVVVVNNDNGQVLFDQRTNGLSISLGHIFFTPETFIGIASVCMESFVGEFEYFAPAASNSNIFVEDIIMQMEGEPEPRTLECETSVTEILSVVFTGNFTADAEVTPPFNTAPPYQIEGAIIEVSLIKEEDQELFAKSTTVALSDGRMLHAADQINVEHNGPWYSYTAPEQEEYYGFDYTGDNSFDYLIGTSAPTVDMYRLFIEQRNCYNVNAADRGGNVDGGDGGFALSGIPGSNTASNTVLLDRVTDDLQLRLYPNPAADGISISQAARNVIVRDGTGRIVYRIAELPAHQVLDISGWVPGLYYLETAGLAGERENLRFVKH